MSVGKWSLHLTQIFFGGFLLAAGVVNQFTPRDEDFGPPFASIAQAATTSLAYLGSDLDTSFGLRRLSTVGWLIYVKQARPDELKNASQQGIDAMKRHLAEQPTDGFSWLALAQFHQINHGFDDNVDAALRMSYYTSRREFYVMMQRVGISLKLYPVLQDDLQQEVHWEAAALVSSQDWTYTRDFARIAMLTNPQGLAIAREEAHRASDYMGQIFDQTVEQEMKLRQSQH